MWQFVAAAQGTNEASTPVATAKLTRHAGADAWDAGACSQQAIAGDGFVEFIANATGAYRAMGLAAQTGAPIVHILNMSRGIYLKGGGTPTQYAVVEGGGEVFTGTYAANDVFRVQRVAGGFTYYRNGDLVYTSSNPVINGALMIESVFFSASSVIQDARFYDATKKAWPALTWLTTQVTAATGNAHVPRRFRFLTPSSVRRGDSLVVMLAAQGRDFVVANSIAWEDPIVAITGTLKRGFVAQRRVAQDFEPKQYFVDVACRHESVGVLLVYRGAFDPGALSNASATDHVATTAGAAPVINKARALDLFLGCSLLYNPQGVTVTTLSGATQRAQFQTTVFATPARICAFDMATRNIGNTGAGLLASGLPGGTSFGTFSFLMPGRPPQRAFALPSDSPGAIGLQAVGI